MRISKLDATGVHGYLNINVEFFDDLTFLVGVNGSGKTSALRLLMALLTPNIDDLGSISFSSVAVTVHDEAGDVVVSATKSPDEVLLSVSSMPEPLPISSSDLELYMDVRRRDETRSPILDKFQKHPIFQRIKSISTPMFLGLDRRLYTPPTLGNEELNEIRRREIMTRRLLSEDQLSRGSAQTALAEVSYLVISKMQEIRASQEQLDETLRTQIFAKAFEYKPSEVMRTPTRFPSRTEIERYRNQLAKIGNAAEGVKIPVPEIQAALTNFFEKMTAVVDSMEKSAQEQTPPAAKTKRSKRKSATPQSSTPAVTVDKNYIEWIINKPQADRIVEHLGLLSEYLERRNALRDPVTRFLSLINSFFEQTKKILSVAKNGQPFVAISSFAEERRTISALSSGERQLLVMLAHLSLNPSLAGSGVFIVDEPELSLHIDWQERFVEAIREANPNVQLILATHSPAIILDRVEACQSMWSSENA